MAKEMKRMSTGVLDEIQGKLGLNDAEFSRALGHSSSAMAGWRTQGTAPMTTYLAAKYLLAKTEQFSKQYHTFVVALNDKDKADSLEAFLRALGVPADQMVRLKSSLS